MASQKRKGVPTSEKTGKAEVNPRKQQKTSLLAEPRFASENTKPEGGNTLPVSPVSFDADPDEFGGIFAGLQQPQHKKPVDTLKKLKSVQNERRAYDAKRSKAAARKDKADAEAKQTAMDVEKEQQVMDAEAKKMEAAEEKDADLDAPVMHRVLYVPQGAWAEDCKQGLTTLEGPLEGAGMAAEDMASLGADGLRQLLLGGFIQQHCSWSGSCPANLLRTLFDLATGSPDDQVATAAFHALSAMIGDVHTQEAALGRVLDGPQESWLYGGGNCTTTCQLGWLPIAEDFLAALRKLGWREDGQSLPAVSPPPTAAVLTPSKGPKVPKRGPKLHCLQLLWRLLAAICRQASEGSLAQPCELLGDAGLVDLMLAALQLRLDPVATILAQDLDNALRAIADGASEELWNDQLLVLASRVGCDDPASLPSMVAGVAEGNSHKRRLAAIRLLPHSSPRCRQLRSHAVVCLLPTLMLPQDTSRSSKGRMGAKGRAKNRQASDSCEAWHALPAMPWWGTAGEQGKAGRSLIEAGLGSMPQYSLWEVDTALRAAYMLVSHMLYQMHSGTLDRTAKPSCVAFLKDWRSFLEGMKQKCDRSLACVVIQGNITDMVDNAEMLSGNCTQDVQ
ncbi:hypothetical protein WJX84_008926 [Apatococcus fuscideae]|uniref:Uncharacterized protein n=1 Tax=Apatococcus fuscideae TaxID=2026836 RepID=A0AAW1SZP0_9CHLO